MSDVFQDREVDELLQAREELSVDLETNGDRSIGAGQGVTSIGEALNEVERELISRGAMEPPELPQIPVGEEFAQTEQQSEQAPQGDAIDRFLDGADETLGGVPEEGKEQDAFDIFLDGGDLPQSFRESDDPQIQTLMKRQEALERSFESRPGPTGIMEAAGFTSAAREIEELANLREQGVDIQGRAATFQQRMEAAFINRQERLDEFFRGNFEDFRNTEVGTVVTVRDESGVAKEVLFDETGLSLGDLADSAPELLDVAASIAGASVAAVSGVVSVPAIAAAAAVAELGAGTGAETLATMQNGGWDGEIFTDILQEQGTDAAVNFALDSFLAGGGRIVRFASGPFGKQMRADPGAAIAAARDRLSTVLGRPFRITPGTLSQSETLMRAEAFVEKVPGAAGVARLAREEEDIQLQELVDELVGGRISGDEFGTRISQVLTNQRDVEAGAVEAARRNAEAITNQRIRDIEESLTTRPLSFNESGELARRHIERNRTKFKADQQNLANRTSSLVRQLPPEQQAFASTANLKKVAKQLEDQFPKQTTEEGRETIVQLFPRGARSLLTGIQKLDNDVTVQELRNVRNGIANMVETASAFPGVGVGMVKKLETELTAAIRGAADNAPSAEIRTALTRELNHFKDNIGKFQTRPVAAAMKGEAQSGFREGEDVLPSLFLRDRPEDIQRVLNVIGENSLATRASQRATISKIMRDTADPVLGDNVADPIAVLKKIEKMSPRTQELLFSGRQEQAKELFRLAGARYGNIDLSLLKVTPGNQDVLTTLQDAMANEVASRRIFEKGVFRRILADEIDVTEMRPEQFVRFTLRDASPNDITELFRRLDDPGLRDQFRTQAAAHILAKADKQSADVIQAIARIDGKVTPGTRMDNVLRQFAENPEDSIEKLQTVFGDEQFQLLKDMALVEAAKAQKRESAAAMGGLVGGSVLSSILNFNLGGAAQIAKYRVIGELLNHGPTRAWLSGKGLPGIPREKVRGRITKGDMVRIGGVTLPEFVQLMMQTYGEASEEAKFAETINQNLGTIVP